MSPPPPGSRLAELLRLDVREIPLLVTLLLCFGLYALVATAVGIVLTAVWG